MKKTKAERDELRLRNEADRDYPRTLAKLKEVLAKVNTLSLTRYHLTQERARVAEEIKRDVAELVISACEEQDAVTARQYRQVIGVVSGITEKLGASMAAAIGSEAMKDLFKEKV
jgi:hypothetical protein